MLQKEADFLLNGSPCAHCVRSVFSDRSAVEKNANENVGAIPTSKTRMISAKKKNGFRHYSRWPVILFRLTVGPGQSEQDHRPRSDR